MRVARIAANIGVIVAAFAAWSACDGPSTTAQQEQPDAQSRSDNPCQDATATYLIDPNRCCGANCTDGAMCDIQLFEGYELNTCVDGMWVTTGQLSDHAPDAAPPPMADASIADASSAGGDSSIVDTSDADVTADAPPDVAGDALADGSSD